MIENTDYFLAVGALIECERIRQKKLASDHKPFNQESFCKHICDTKTYRRMSVEKREINHRFYGQLLQRLGLQMAYDDELYKKLHVRLANLNDAITKYNLHDIEEIYGKIENLIGDCHPDIYFQYIRWITTLLTNYYLHNQFPSLEEMQVLLQICMGFPRDVRDMMMDLIFKYYRLHTTSNQDYFSYIKKFPYESSTFLPNRINYIQSIHDRDDFDQFTALSNELIPILESTRNYFRLIDVYDLQIAAMYYTDRIHVEDVITKADNNVTSLFEKYKYKADMPIKKIEWPLKRKISQYTYHKGCILFLLKNYEQAIHILSEYLLNNQMMEVHSKVMLISCYHHLHRKIPSAYLELHHHTDDQKFLTMHMYFQMKYLHDEQLITLNNYLEYEVLPLVMPEDDVLIRVLTYELSLNAKNNRGYVLFHHFFEKLGMTQ